MKILCSWYCNTIGIALFMDFQQYGENHLQSFHLYTYLYIFIVHVPEFTPTCVKISLEGVLPKRVSQGLRKHLVKIRCSFC